MLTQDVSFLKSTYRKALIPCMLSILAGYLNILADGILVGQYIGIKGLAAINLCVPLYLLLCVIGSFWVSGTAISASEEIGKNNLEKAQLYYGSCLSLCFISSIVATIIGILTLPTMASALSADEEIRSMIQAYAGVTIVGALPKILIYIPLWYLRLEGKNKSVTIMMVILGVGNVVLDLFFLKELNMGVFGVSLASVIATVAADIFGFIRIHTAPSSFKLRFAFLNVFDDWKKIYSAGSPAALNNLFQTIRIIVVNIFLNSLGGSVMVATFTAVNGIAAFAEAVTVGVPNAGIAMLGVFHGEHDNESSKIILQREWWDGLVCTIAFGAIIILCADLIRDAYALNGVSLFFPMICLAVSLVLGLWNNILISFYSVSKHPELSNELIFGRVLFFAILSLIFCRNFNMNIWLFLPLSEAFTLIFWIFASAIISKRKDNITRFLLLDTTLQKSGKVTDFALTNSLEEICNASERISDFCNENGMDKKEYMIIRLSMEELMRLITKVNGETSVSFAIRVFALTEVVGIRIRYNGMDFDPIHSERYEAEEFMGIRMIEKLVKKIVYYKVFGSNTLLILIRGSK